MDDIPAAAAAAEMRRTRRDFEDEAPSAPSVRTGRQAHIFEDEAPSAAMPAREDGRKGAYAGLDRGKQSLFLR